MTFGAQGYALAHGEGEGLWFFNGLLTVKAGGPDTREAFTLIEAELPAGGGPPPHIHHNEEEGFYVAQGEVTIYLGNDERTLAAGGFAMAPRGVPHAFRLETPDATLVLLVSPGPAHEAMFREMGEPATARSIPEAPAMPPDVPELAKIAARHGTQIVGPPPGG